MVPVAKVLSLACVIVLACVVACSSDEPSADRPSGDAGVSADSGAATELAPGTATLTGGVTNRSLAPVEAFAMKSYLYNPDDTSIFITSKGGFCTTRKIVPRSIASTTYLQFDFARTWPPPVGTYPVVRAIRTEEDGGITQGAFISLVATDGACMFDDSDASKALDGSTVTIEKSSDALVRGSFALQFQGGSIDGAFAVPLCDVVYPEGEGRTCLP